VHCVVRTSSGGERRTESNHIFLPFASSFRQPLPSFFLLPCGEDNILIVCMYNRNNLWIERERGRKEKKQARIIEDTLKGSLQIYIIMYFADKKDTLTIKWI
jgi:hypothetical protein